MWSSLSLWVSFRNLRLGSICWPPVWGNCLENESAHLFSWCCQSARCHEPLSEMLGLPDPGAGLETGRQVINRVTSSPLYPWFCFLRFQLPVVNWGLKILDEMNNSYVLNYTPFGIAWWNLAPSSPGQKSCFCPVYPWCVYSLSVGMDKHDAVWSFR